jgi:hypothetical protein
MDSGSLVVCAGIGVLMRMPERSDLKGLKSQALDDWELG